MKLKNFLKLAIPSLIAILSFIGGKYQFNKVIEILILSLIIVLLASYLALIFEELEKERKKVLCYELAKSLYDNFDALRKTEYETSTRFDLVLVKWNQSNRNIDDWDEFCSYADINPLERSNV